MLATFTFGVLRGITMTAGIPESGGVIGDALGVVAGRHGHHAPGPLLGRELQEPVEGAPVLERRRVLQVLELQPQVGAGDDRQRLRPQGGRADHVAADGGRRPQDVAVPDRQFGEARDRTDRL